MIKEPYLTVEEADELISARFINDSEWASLDEPIKLKLLNIASDNIDTLKFKGRKYSISQQRQFPRCLPSLQSDYDMYSKNFTTCVDTIPYEIQVAVCNEALMINSKVSDSIAGISDKALTGFSAGKYSESYDLNLLNLSRTVVNSTYNILQKFVIRGTFGTY